MHGFDFRHEMRQQHAAGAFQRHKLGAVLQGERPRELRGPVARMLAPALPLKVRISALGPERMANLYDACPFADQGAMAESWRNIIPYQRS
jgi:hypothetical protein